MSRMPLKHAVLGVTVLGTLLAACDFVQADNWRRMERRARRQGYNYNCQPVHVNPCCGGVYGQSDFNSAGYGNVQHQGYYTQGGQRYYSNQPRQVAPIPAGSEYSAARPTYQQGTSSDRDGQMQDRYDNTAPAPPRSDDNSYLNDRNLDRNQNRNWDDNDRAVPPAPGLNEADNAARRELNEARDEATDARREARDEANDARREAREEADDVADEFNQERREARDAADDLNEDVREEARELNNDIRQQGNEIQNDLNSERNELLNESGSSDLDGTRIEADSGIDAAASKED